MPEAFTRSFQTVLKFLLVVFPLIINCYAYGQELIPDSSAKVTQVPDTLSTDTVPLSSSNDLKSRVEYDARDSIRYDITEQKVYLFGKAIVKYEQIVLEADKIMIDWVSKTLYARGSKDSLGKPLGKPVFKEGADEFTANAITYNFESKKGKITQVYIQEGQGYILGKSVKKQDDDNFFVESGKYTTCNLEDPHYYIASNKLKIIQNKKIVTGPAYLVLEDVPTPLVIPFGFFPNKKGRSSGIVLPTYGESANLGFFLRNGGYYFGISDHIDAEVNLDLYTKGSWGTRVSSMYKNRYKFGGNFQVSYSEIKQSFRELPDFSLQTDFFVRWNHSQDPRARPNSVFSASVNAGSANYFTNNLSYSQDFLTNTFNSSISYSTTWPGKPYSLSLSATHSQNSLTRDVSLSLPNATFNVSRFYPFKRNLAIGSDKWYEKIGITYQTNLRNTINTKDTLLLRKESLEDFRYGISHSVPIATSFKIMKFFTMSPSVSYNELWYLNSIEKNWDPNAQLIDTDTINGFLAARFYNLSTSLSTRVYGLLQFRKFPIAAVRHVFTPTFSFNYRPDFSEEGFDYYREVQSDSAATKFQTYSRFQNGIFGGPPSGKSSSLSFSFDNNIEMKVRQRTDSVDALKKIKLLESLRLSGAYNFAADSLNLSHLSLSGRAIILGKLNLNFSSTYDPYISDSLGRRFNKYEWEVNKRIGRLTNANMSVGFNFNNQGKKEKKSEYASDDQIRDINASPYDYVDFTVPWNLAVNYSLNYSNLKPVGKTVNQTLGFYGDLLLTEKWKVTFNSGWDFEQHDFSYTSVGFFRDLHCWEMRLNWIPFGFQQSWNFQINVKSSVLQDLKLTKKNDRFDSSRF